MKESSISTRIQGVVAIVVGCVSALATVLLLENVGEGYLVRFQLAAWLREHWIAVARWTANVFGCQIRDGTSLMVELNNTVTFVLGGVMGSFDRLVLLAFLMVVAAAAACRTWGYGWRRTGVLTAVAVLGAAPLAVVLSAFGTGVGISLARRAEDVPGLVYWGRDAGYLAACGILAASWGLEGWIFGAEDVAQPSAVPAWVVTPSMWVAIASSLGAAAYYALATVGSVPGHWMSTSVSGRFTTWRFAASTGLLLASAALVIFSAFGTSRLVRWAWIPASGLIVLGGWIGGAVPLVALVIAARDEKFRLARGVQLRPGFRQRIARRQLRPLLPWIWLMIALMGIGVWVRLQNLVLDEYVGLRWLAHPALFWSLTGAAGVCLAWQMIHVRAKGRQAVIAMLPALLLLAGAGSYGWGMYRELPIRHRRAQAAAYSAQVHQVMTHLPLKTGHWRGKDNPVHSDLSESSFQPFSRIYTDDSRGMQVQLIIAQSSQWGDVLAYQPVVFYSGEGYIVKSSADTQWEINGQTIRGKEYAFSHFQNGELHVAYFILEPNGTTQGAIPKSLPKGDALGGASFQLLIRGDMPEEMRRQVIQEMFTLAVPVIDAVKKHP